MSTPHSSRRNGLEADAADAFAGGYVHVFLQAGFGSSLDPACGRCIPVMGGTAFSHYSMIVASSASSMYVVRDQRDLSQNQIVL